MLKKIIIREDKETYTVLSTDAHHIGVLEEDLRRIGVDVRTSYGKVASLAVDKDQGEGPDALDKETWVEGAIHSQRPSPYPNWETAFALECLGYDEGAPLHFQQLRQYLQTRQAPQEFYELFEAEPVGDLKVINCALIVTELQR